MKVSECIEKLRKLPQDIDIVSVIGGQNGDTLVDPIEPHVSVVIEDKDGFFTLFDNEQQALDHIEDIELEEAPDFDKVVVFSYTDVEDCY